MTHARNTFPLPPLYSPFHPVHHRAPIDLSKSVLFTQRTMASNEQVSKRLNALADQLNTLELTLEKLVGTVEQLKATPPKALLPKLPDDIIGEILALLTQAEVYPFLLVSRSVNRLARDRLWRHVFVCPIKGTNYFAHGQNADRRRWLVVRTSQFAKLVAANAFQCCHELVFYNTRYPHHFYRKVQAALPHTDIRIVGDTLDGSRKPNRWYSDGMLSTFPDGCPPEISGTSLEVIRKSDSANLVLMPTLASCPGWANLRHLTINDVAVPKTRNLPQCQLKTLVCGGKNLDNLACFVDFSKLERLMIISVSLECTGLASKLTRCTHLCLSGGRDHSAFLGAMPKPTLRFFRYHAHSPYGDAQDPMAKRRVQEVLKGTLPHLERHPISVFVTNQGRRVPVDPWVTFFDEKPLNDFTTGGNLLAEEGVCVHVCDVVAFVNRYQLEFSHMDTMLVDGKLYRIHQVFGVWLHVVPLSEKKLELFYYAS